MHHSCLTSLFLALLLALAMLSQTGCVIPAVCDPDSEQFDPEECAQVCRLNSTSPFNEGCEYVTFLARLNKAAYGTFPGSPPSFFDYSCPSRLTCDDPVCVTVEQNGGFERPPGSELPPALWFGDKVEKDEIRCDGVGGLRFIATTPDGPGPSASAQVFQVFDYHALVPEVDHARLNRVRAQAALHVLGSEPDDDRQFGLQINAYAGDPATFPREGDPEVFLPDVPGLLAETRKTVLSMGDTTTWQPVRAELLLPEGTDYFVVFLEAVEDVQNDVTGDEFRSHRMDAVQVVIDAGNTAPVARPFTVQTPQGAAIYIAVSNHAYDLTSPLDRTSVVIVQPPSFGVAMLTPLTPPASCSTPPTLYF